MCVVVPPLILGTIYIAVLNHYRRVPATNRSKLIWSAVSGLLAFVAGGFAETYLALQTTALLILLVFGLTRQESKARKLLPLVMAGLVASLGVMAIIYIAPGTSAILAAKSAGEPFAVIPQIMNPSLLDEIGPDPNQWLNQCARDYYGITVVTFPSSREAISLP